MDASHSAEQLGLVAGTDVDVSLLVRHVATGRVVPETEHRVMPGFAPVAVWGGAMPTPTG